MGDVHSFRLDKEQQDILEKHIEENGCDQSEAGRKLISAGGVKLGYTDYGTVQTRLRRIIQRSADGFAICALVWLGITMLAPVGYRALAIPLLGISVALYTTDRIIASREPHVSKRLAALIALGGDSA